MAGVLRRLVTEVVLKSTKAVKDLKAYDALWKTVAKSVDASASAIERSADRAAAAMSRISAGAASVRAGVPRGSGGGGASRKDPLDAAIASANKIAARQAGLAAGAQPVNDATAALGSFAKASEKAKAAVKDLEKQVERNRREMAELRAQAIKTGDADGALAARMQGLGAATAIASRDLASARKELRGFEGGLIQAIKQATVAKVTVQALGTAMGNAITGAVRGIAGGISGALGESAKSAMDFEKALVDVAKVAQDADLKDGLLDPRIKQGIKDTAKALGVMPTEVAELTAQITAAFSGKEIDGVKIDLVALASDVTKIGVAWDISGKQAGEFFKQTSAGLQLNADETKALFGSINELGNKLGVKSSEIAEAMTRSAGVLKGANISGETGAALNATLIKAGASAEVAATGVRTFIGRLGSGGAATDKQISAFQDLGLSAEVVAKNLASGDVKKAEGQIKEIVAALVQMGKDAPEKRMETMIKLFGSESIGSIGAAATAVDTLATSFEIAGNKGAALESVQQEYLRVSDTTAARVEKLKANIGVLAIEFGDALLPHIDRLVKFLTSDVGQEWGRNAVAKAVEVVTGLASALGAVGSGLSSLIDMFGATGVAVAGLGAAVAGLSGPFGIALAAGVAMGAGIASAVDSVVNRVRNAQQALAGLHEEAEKISDKEKEAERKEMVDEADAMLAANEKDRRVQAATDRWETRERAKRGIKAGSEEDLAITRKAARMRESLRTGAFSSQSFDERLGSFEASLVDGPSAASPSAPSDRAEEFQSLLARRKSLRPSEKARLKRLSRELDISLPQSSGGRGSGVNLSGYSDTEKDELFKELSARKAAGAVLKPSEAALLRALSKNLDRAVPGKMSKMDQQLAALSPDLAGVLRGADGSASKDPLSLGVLKAAGAANGLGGIGGGSGGVGPGPNITTTQFFTTITVQQAIDARSSGSVPENIRAAAYDAGTQVGNIVVTGLDRARALKQGGGRMA